MPILKWFPAQGQPRTFVVYKPVTTVGRALGNDVSIPSHGLADTHVQVLFDGRDFNLEEVDKQAEILINGKKKRRARLVHGDRVTLGDAELQFSIFDEPHAPQRPHTPSQAESAPAAQLAGVRKLHEFSEKLMTMKNLDELLEAMLDAVIDVTGAEKGLVLLLDEAYGSDGSASGQGGKPVIRTSRQVNREAI